MCGRFYLIEDSQTLEEHFNAEGQSGIRLFPRYNIAPNQKVPIIREGAAGHQIVHMRWGLIPHWSKESKLKYSTINARAETVDKKPVYRIPFKRSRCLVPASGFYEWKKVESGKQPYLIRRKTGLMAFAGLWDRWEGEHEEIDSFSIIVTDANRAVLPVHDRMPVILDQSNYDFWLSSESSTDELKALLIPWRNDDIELQPVSKYVNSPRNDDPKCIEVVSS